MSTSDRRWALVAGGSGGLGRAVSLSMAKAGWNVAVGYNSNRDGAERTAEGVSESGGDVLLQQLDLGDASAAEQAVRSVADAVDLSGAVYAAGPMIPMDFIANLTAEQFGSQIDRDLKASFHFLHPLLPDLRRNKGAITAIVTPVIARYTRMDVLSSVPKAGVQQLIRGLAAEEGRFGVRANSVGVGVIKGEGLWTALIDSGDFTEKGLEQALSAIPLGEFGVPEDVADAVTFLMSDRARWITGQTLNVDGGYSV